MSYQPLISHISQYIELSNGDIDNISAHVSHRRYLKGQYLVQQGDVCKHESFVVRGCLKTFRIDRDGQEHVLRFAIENWWAADLGSFVNQTPANYNVQCLEPTEVIQITHQDIELLYQLVPKLERFFRIIIQNAYVASENRVIRNFSMTAKERYLDFQQQYPNIERRVPQYLVASYLGITKEFLSKIRNQLLTDSR